MSSSGQTPPLVEKETPHSKIRECLRKNNNMVMGHDGTRKKINRAGEDQQQII
jgi:hypothetical protein